MKYKMYEADIIKPNQYFLWLFWKVYCLPLKILVFLAKGSKVKLGNGKEETPKEKKQPTPAFFLLFSHA